VAILQIVKFYKYKYLSVTKKLQYKELRRLTARGFDSCMRDIVERSDKEATKSEVLCARGTTHLSAVTLERTPVA
jgi:hypothetical protein